MSNQKQGSGEGEGAQPKAVSRRGFGKLAVGALGAVALGAAAVTINHVSPGLIYDVPRFHAGKPGEYALNSVTFFYGEKVYLVRTAQGFYAESAICTHQHCVTHWNPQAQLIECPCHGSRYKRDGEVVHGPAPQALPHFAVELARDGTLWVDKRRVVKRDVVLKA